MFRFIIRLAIFGLIAATASLWATAHFGQNKITQGIARVVAKTVVIADLISEPAKYEGSVVQISGRPVPHLKFAALGFGGLILQDEKENKIVLLVRAGMPTADAAGVITVVGQFRSLLEIGAFSYPALVIP